MEKIISQHESINKMYQKVTQDGMTNVADRYEAQEKVRCHAFCAKGLSCQLCSNGPCRIIPGKLERGVCGIDGDGLVMRNMVHKLNMGIAAYTYHCKEAAQTLKATALGKTPFSLKDVDKLDKLATTLGVSGNTAQEKAVNVAETVLSSLHQGSDEVSLMVERFAPASRRTVWDELGITPGGPTYEILDSVTRCMTNIDGDYISLAKVALRLGLANIYGALIPLELIQDIIFGTPQPHTAEVDLGVIDPDYVNILPNGHEPFVGAALIEAAHRPEIQEKARQAGARGIHIIGSIETGQELLQRFLVDDVFVGLTGNWMGEEFVLATGGVDLLAMDMNCSLQTLVEYAKKYNATLVQVSKLVGIRDLESRLNYLPGKVEEQALALIDLAVDNFKRRKDKRAEKGLPKTKIMTGFSNEALLKALGGTLDPLLEVIKNGSIKGVVALVSCTTFKNGPHDTTTVAVTKELIKRNMLVLSAGCGNAATQVAGLNSLAASNLAGEGIRTVCQKLGVPPVLSFGTCSDVGRLIMLVTVIAEALKVDPSQLPVAVTAPEYMEQKATIDAFGAVAFGLYTHVSPIPPVTGSTAVVKLLTETVESLTGGKLAVGDEPGQAVDGIEAHINKKRAALGI